MQNRAFDNFVCPNLSLSAIQEVNRCFVMLEKKILLYFGVRVHFVRSSQLLWNMKVHETLLTV